MTRLSQAIRRLPVPLGVFLGLAGCDGGAGGAAPNPAPSPAVAAPAAPQPASPEPTALGEAKNLKSIMVTIGKGPNALNQAVGKALKEDPPSWETIGPKSQEYARLTALLVPMEPPTGAKDSWTEKSQAFALLAADLDKAVQARDPETARTSQDALSNACMSCHREHRKRGRGPGRGGRPGGGPPAGGAPPQ